MPFDNIILARKPMPFDRRDLRLSMFITPAMRLEALTMTERDWNVPVILDQGNTPHCVGFAWAGFGVAYPVSDPWDNSMGDKIYYTAKEIDGEPGQENGSNTRSGVQAFMKYGVLDSNAYAFAYSLDDIVTWVLTKGPVITGTDWYYDMFSPDTDGTVHVGGGVAGGHEWMINGVDTVKKEFHCVNSWGLSFGVNGHFKISFDDYRTLFDNQGDACTTLEIEIPVPVPPAPPEPPAPKVPKWFKDFICWLCKLFGGTC